MPYCTVDDIKANIPDKHIVELTDDNDNSVINIHIINEAISYAESLIDGYLRGKYPVPLNPVPKLITKLCVDIAIFYIYSRRFELEMGEAMQNRYKNAIQILENINTDVIRLGIGNDIRKLKLYEV